jgi:hypothetical protein
MKKLGRKIKRHNGIHGGKISFAKQLNKMGRDIKDDLKVKEAKDNLQMVKQEGKKLGNKAMKKVIKPTGKYITNTDGLLSDVVNYGIPAATGATFGAIGSLSGNPLVGVAASALGSKLGTMASDKIAKETMIQSRTGEGIKKRGRKPKTGSGDLIHIDIASHNAKGRKASNSMSGGELEIYHPVGHRGLDTNQPVPSFEQTKSRKRIVSDSALLNMISEQDLKDVKRLLSSEDSLTKPERKKMTRKIKKDFKDNVKQVKKLTKGSDEAKEHMAKIRAMRKNK